VSVLFGESFFISPFNFGGNGLAEFVVRSEG
jgi:hypothetical protein